MSATETRTGPGPVLVSDFDGTMTRHDFYRLVIERLLPPETPDFWGEYLAGRITHFDALRLTFEAAPAGEAALADLADRMELDPDLATEVESLRHEGWRIVVASAGCLWYIRRLLDAAGVALEVHANPGQIENGRLAMRRPEGSPFYSYETGIDKVAIARQALAGGHPVAFAGDGLTDVEPALLVPARWRFARGSLAETLRERGEEFRPFTRWAEVARALRRKETD